MKANVMQHFWIYGIAGMALIAVSCEKTEYVEAEPIHQEGMTTLVFDARYGDADFELNKAYDYKLTNPDGEFDLQYTFTRLRYWVSNVKFINAAGEEVLIPDSYYLIEENNEIPVQDGTHGKIYPANKREAIAIRGIPAGDYVGVKFSIGVAPKYNDNLTLQAGELTPLNGMASDSWMWFTSYIFTSLSGEMTWVKETPESKTFFWETGSNEQYKEKTVTFESSITINSQAASNVELEVDVEQLIGFEYPWSNSVIGATTPDLMEELTANYLDKAISLRAAVSSAK
ncbi:MbnP family protein [Parapedobacter koreensis]|uniref:Copper-binding protein MbnP-like domain-containing protein n=1 Tax=Parapedobacter koreensis TaxID=332977 RepID=A0A1H7EZT8_9SPHI|nr:MbnP family protein [Parapedobacter koreensis]SEK19426.1 hypothetical protein SAMN05421740_101157 [Parapedobacter koreensis]